MSGTEESKNGHEQMQLLLVGDSDDDFVYLRDLLARTGDGQVALQHAHTAAEAFAFLERTSYDLLLCDYKCGHGSELQQLRELQKGSSAAPVVFLGDYVDEATVAKAIKEGAGNCGQVSSLNPSSITSAVSCAIDVYCKERQRRSAEDKVRKLWQAVEQSADLVVITNRSGVIEYVNPAFEAITGYSRDEAIGRTPRLLKSGHQAPEMYRELWETILAGHVFRGVLINRRRNGDIFYAEKTITPVRDSEGKIRHFISNDRDITERRRLEAQLQQAQKMDAIGKLAGGVAHDFNNLLMVISAYAEMMLDSLSAEHPLRRNVHEIMTATRHAADLTRQLLAFGRKQLQVLQALDLNEVIKEINKMLPRLIGEDIELVFLPGEKLDKVKADRVQMEQVVMNLAANARDAMPHGGKLTLETRSVRLDEAYVQHHKIVPAGNYVLLTVSDSGLGISPEHVAHIFEPFYTTKAEGKGTGLGLATVYGVVKQSGGYIWVYSEPGMGTTFKIYLPGVQLAAAEAESPKPTEKPFRGCETLLLVEDEDAVRQPTREFLTMSGYIVLEAKNGEEAVRIAESYQGQIDLMITDVVMPRMGGAQVARQLAASRPTMKVLFVSGYAENTVLRHGPIDVTLCFLQKPFSLKTLARKIRDVLQAETAAVTATASSAD